MSEAHDFSGFKVDSAFEALLYLKSEGNNNFLLDGYDEVFIAILNRLPEQIRLIHVEKDGNKILEKWFDKQYLMKIIKSGYRKDVQHLINKSEVLYDQNQVIENIQEISRLTAEKKGQLNICIQFSKFLESFSKAKECFQSNLIMDSFHYCNEAITHWAKLAILENGMVHNDNLWEQVHGIDCTVYKLYEELSGTFEPMHKRIELFLLASEFAIMSKMNGSTQFLIHLINSRNEPWSLNELYHHPSLEDEEINLPMLLTKMVKRSLVNEVRVTSCFGIEKKYMGIIK